MQQPWLLVDTSTRQCEEIKTTQIMASDACFFFLRPSTYWFVAGLCSPPGGYFSGLLAASCTCIISRSLMSCVHTTSLKEVGNARFFPLLHTAWDTDVVEGAGPLFKPQTRKGHDMDGRDTLPTLHDRSQDVLFRREIKLYFVLVTEVWDHLTYNIHEQSNSIKKMSI